MKSLIAITIAILFAKQICRAQEFTFQPSFAAITVANIDSSINWYAKMLNLQTRNRVDNAEKGFKQAILVNKETMIELVELEAGISLDSLLSIHPKGTYAHGYYKFGFTVSNIEAVHSKFALMKVNFIGRMVSDPVSNKKTFLVADPDGNLVQFFEQ